MVIWTPQARADLKAIYDYIAKDSTLNAKSVVKDIKIKVDALDNLPNIGKFIPEFQFDDLREIHIHSGRVFYQYRQPACYIIAVVHKRRSLLE
jgi:addiction module RelE/StbE family toxin